MQPEVKKCGIAQVFGANANPLYAGQGFKGHTGVDEACGYGTDIYALKHGVVYKIIDADHPANDGSGYWAIFIISPDVDGKYCEWQIGHVSKIFCKVGDVVEPWTIVGQEGNHGSVYYGSTLITKAMQDAGDHRGAHRHWNKKILVRQTLNERENNGGMHLTSYTGDYKDADGYFYQVQDFRNGYNGSVDPMPDLDAGYKAVNDHFKGVTPPAPPVPSFHHTFNIDLDMGQTSDEVLALQKALKLDGSFPKAVLATGFFGPVTVQAVKVFQMKYGIANSSLPGYGRVGPKTRAKLNALFS